MENHNEKNQPSQSNKGSLKGFVYILLFFLVLTGVKLYYSKSTGISESTNRYHHLGGDFTLQHKKGIFKLKDLKGKPSILYFGFTHCPDVCPLSLNKLNKALDGIDPRIHPKINKVFISVDYKRDTPQSVHEYGKYFSEDFISLTGTQTQIENVTKKYAIHFEYVSLKDSALKFTIDHTSRFFLLDKNGKIINTYTDILNDDDFKRQLKKRVHL